jgi:heme oxygenase
LTPLSARLRSETGAAHAAAESSLVVRQIMAGTIERFEYCRMMVNLHAIYQKLEQQLEAHKSNASIQHVADARLARAAAIDRDLTHLIGERWNQIVALEAATSSYLKRLELIGANQPERLVAHSYVRYMGDLSGGQIISRAVRPVLGADADQALHFYHFGSKAQVAEMKARFRDGLDRIESEAEANAIVEEALLAFGAAQNLFEQLALKVNLPPVTTEENAAR